MVNLIDLIVNKIGKTEVKRLEVFVPKNDYLSNPEISVLEVGSWPKEKIEEAFKEMVKAGDIYHSNLPKGTNWKGIRVRVSYTRKSLFGVQVEESEFYEFIPEK